MHYQVQSAERTYAALRFASAVGGVDLSPRFSTMTMLRFPDRLSHRRSQYEEETLYRRANYSSD